MPIDLKPFVELAVINGWDDTHYEGCSKEHLPCAILYLVGALDAAQERLDEYLAEIERLRAENQALEEYRQAASAFLKLLEDGWKDGEDE